MMSMAALRRGLAKMETLMSGGRPVALGPERCSRWRCHKTKAAMTSTDTMTRTGIQGADPPRTLPSVSATMRATRAAVMGQAPTQSKDGLPLLPSLASAVGGRGGGMGGMKARAAMVMAAAAMAVAPKTHFQLEYSVMRPDMRLPHILPRGAPAAGKRQTSLAFLLGRHETLL